ncbi:acetyl-CoA C-acyltransferase [Limnoglobus roseus]|uniref:Acetyl-CoA C-acetyltransferase n=1 Tax=Limnoglobus roseus TaxID=2598579 RepID=A0A5C1A7X4_9BACT|nr:acetyl-CoA C-acyltransferase [Limnoglobus roseus]QEL15419.1 acetyl-CoA C-acetyltransferase [Limnoglobus roseus]
MTTFIVSAVRTPIGKFLGGLAEFTAPQLGSFAVREALKRANLPPEAVDEVIMGHVVQAGCGQNPARQAALAAGLPDTINAHTTNMVCGSGLKAVMLADQAIRCGDASIIVAGGMESMSRAPFLLPNVRGGYKYGDQTAVDALIRDGLWCPFEKWPMGNAAEHTASQCGISRAEQDRFAAQSHLRAAAAWASGAFTAEAMPVQAAKATINRDEGIRPDSTAEGLAKLKPAFKPDGTVTAGNASQLSDGAAAVVVASEASVRKYGLKPLAKILASATSGVAPKDIFLAPVSAIRKLTAALPLDRVDLFELNEAFASQMLGCAQELKLAEAKVNVNGGAIALGHPIGASGARVLTTLVHALHARGLRYGIASLCLGGGNAVAVLVERV